MPKRKREQLEEIIENIEDRAVRIKASRLTAKIDQGNKILKDAIQLAKGFERQKLGRRQKQASNEPHALLRLREEVIILKELEPGKTAKDYLFKQLAKTKRIAESPAFVELYGTSPKSQGPASKAEGNVLGRLIKSNPVKEVLPNIITGIREVLGVDKQDSSAVHGRIDASVRPTDPETISQRAAPIQEDDEGFARFSDVEELKVASARARLLKHLGLEDGEDGEDDIDGQDESEMWSGDDRLAASSDDSESDGGNSISRDQIRKSRMSTPDSSNDDSDEHLDKSSRAPLPLSRKANIKHDNSDYSKTTFLPALSMGGYYSGDSDSDSNDDRGSAAKFTLANPARKNRRGQRARQQIAEAKFGKNAKHLIKQRETGPEHKSANGESTGWDAKRGAVGARGPRGKDQYRSQTRPGSNRFTGANSEAVNGTRATSRSEGVVKSAAAMHPSWVAAKKKKQEASNAAFAGKKITFD